MEEGRKKKGFFFSFPPAFLFKLSAKNKTSEGFGPSEV
jgi:hypothetical protein